MAAAPRPSERLPKIHPEQRYRAVLLVGAPGTGKGTQGAILEKIPGFFHFAMGDALRNIDIRSESGKKFYEYSSRGELVPDEFVIRFWALALNAHATLGDFKPHDDLLILDGMPRTVAQAQILESHIEVLRIIHLVCKDENAMFERLRRRALKENRIDDASEDVIRRRMKVYTRETEAVLDFYPRDKVHKVQSEGSPARVLYQILAVVAPLQDQHYTGLL